MVESAEVVDRVRVGGILCASVSEEIGGGGGATHSCGETNGAISARQVGEKRRALGKCSIREVALELGESGRGILRSLGIRECSQRTGSRLTSLSSSSMDAATAGSLMRATRARENPSRR